MHHPAIRHPAMIISACCLAAITVLWALLAAPALAQNHFVPALSGAQTTKMPPVEAAAYQPSATPKRLTPVRTRRPEASTPRVAGASGARATEGGRVSESARARSILAAQIAAHPILKGTTIRFGDARGYQAISYYRSGEIVLSRNHTASLTRIIGHEVWHIIDWRDNGRIDWGENVPPR